jgi:hypothetical protein
MLEKLTPEQIKKMDEYKEMGFKAAYDTTKGDEKIAETGIKEIMKWAGYKKTHVYFVDSPLAVQKKLNALQKTKNKYFDFAIYGEGGIEKYWILFYDFFAKECSVAYTQQAKERLEVFESVIDNCSFMVQGEAESDGGKMPKGVNTGDGIVVVSRKPVKAYRGIGDLPHKDGGAAFEWADGYGIYLLNGVVVPKWATMTSAKKITAKQYFSETNVEVKREIYRKIGEIQFLKITKAKLIHQTKGINPYKLYYTDLGVKVPTNFLLMKNPSVKGLWHSEVVGLSGELKTVQSALNFRAQKLVEKDENWNPCEIA